MFALLVSKHIFTLLNGGQWPSTTPEEPCCNIDSVWGCDFTAPKPLGGPGVMIFFTSKDLCFCFLTFNAGQIICSSKCCYSESESFLSGLKERTDPDDYWRRANHKTCFLFAILLEMYCNRFEVFQRVALKYLLSHICLEKWKGNHSHPALFKPPSFLRLLDSQHHFPYSLSIASSHGSYFR